MKVRDVMTSAVITVQPETTFKETAQRLLDYGVTGLPVVDDKGRLVGLVTEADLMSKEAFGTRQHRPLEALLDLLTGEARWVGKAAGLTAGQVMTTDVVTARPNEDMRVAARRMLDRQVKRLPVVEDDRLVGIVSRHDLRRPPRPKDEALLGGRRLLTLLGRGLLLAAPPSPPSPSSALPGTSPGTTPEGPCSLSSSRPTSSTPLPCEAGD